jgi:hypothetical protein
MAAGSPTGGCSSAGSFPEQNSSFITYAELHYKPLSGFIFHKNANEQKEIEKKHEWYEPYK